MFGCVEVREHVQEATIFKFMSAAEAHGYIV